MSYLSTALLAQTLEDHIEWMASWTRNAFFERQNHIALASSLPEPESFAKWRAEAVKVVQDQPAVNKLVGIYDQFHRLAKLAILKTPDGMSIPVAEYDAVVMKYKELVSGLRRLERASVATVSGLDPLTGLHLRAGMRDDLTRELNRFLRTRKPFCVAMMDIDYFKKVNDAYGRENGDKVLASVCNYISCSVRPFDGLWRWDGEKVLICLKEVDLRMGRQALERVRSGLEKFPIRLFDGREITVTASFGLVVSERNSTVEDLVQGADKALHSAKSSGRNRVSSF